MNALSGKLLPVFCILLVTYSGAVGAESCEAVVRKLDTWYNSTPDGCGSDPAVDCSGIMLRATHRAPKGEYDVWNPSPQSEKSGGVSVSWMRSDKIGYEDPGLKANNGILFTPRQFVAAPQKKLDVYCAFPIDAWTDHRDQRGCGDYSGSKRVEQSCQSLGIDDLTGWKDQYAALGGSANRQDRHRRQCAFSMSGGMSRTARRDAFKQFIAARQSIAETREGREVQTELRVVAWKKNEDVPIAAFFYSNREGKGDAMKNQFDYYQRTGRWVPVVKMDFPANAQRKTRFSCDATAQHRDLPRPFDESVRSCPSYIEKAEWVKRDDPYLGRGTWSLSVTPTACGRKVSKSETEAMYAELVRKYANDPRWSGANYGGGMRRQLVCHLAMFDKGRPVRDKTVYNLEPVRRDVTHQQSLADGCNPHPAVRYP